MCARADRFAASYHLPPVLSRISCHETHLRLCVCVFTTGEEREKPRRRVPAHPLCRVTPHKATAHTYSFAPHLRVEESQPGGDGDDSSTSQRQPVW